MTAIATATTTVADRGTVNSVNDNSFWENLVQVNSVG